MFILALLLEQNGHGAAGFVNAVLENPTFANCAVVAVCFCLQYLIMTHCFSASNLLSSS